MRILVMRIHFTGALKFTHKLRTYYYRKLKNRISRGPVVLLLLFHVMRKFKLRDLPWTQNWCKSRNPCNSNP